MPVPILLRLGRLSLRRAPPAKFLLFLQRTTVPRSILDVKARFCSGAIAAIHFQARRTNGGLRSFTGIRRVCRLRDPLEREPEPCLVAPWTLARCHLGRGWKLPASGYDQQNRSFQKSDESTLLSNVPFCYLVYCCQLYHV